MGVNFNTSPAEIQCNLLNFLIMHFTAKTVETAII